MFRLISGKAGTGKTAAITGEIRKAVEDGKGNIFLLVPEQYSHEAERELASVCPDTLSLYAEVVSFSGLYRRIAAEKGGAAVQYLDGAGKLLCMASAMKALLNTGALRVYARTASSPEMHSAMIKAMDEFKLAGVGPDDLRLAAGCDDIGLSLGEKLLDLADIMEAYDAVIANGRADPSDRLTALAAMIRGGALPEGSVLYVDGFTDFTRAEMEVIYAAISAGADVSVCLTMDDNPRNELFTLPRLYADRLMKYAREAGVEVRREEYADRSYKRPELSLFADSLFGFVGTRAESNGAVRAFRADSISDECELAAGEVLRLVRETGCRYKDIAVAVRGYEDYAQELENTFELYGIPLYASSKTPLLARPLPALIMNAYNVILGGWSQDDVISYVRTGLAGVSQSDGDILANYLFKWQIRAPAWLSRGDWKRYPDGYVSEDKKTEAGLETLRRINAVRRTVSGPLTSLAKKSEEAKTASQQVRALSSFFEELELPRRLSERASALFEAGRQREAMEYGQLWDLTVNAMEQTESVLGDTPMNSSEFARLFCAMLSGYEISTIPVSLDSVTAGDFDRMRRRSIKHLIVLGAGEDRLPSGMSEGGILSGDEREHLRASAGLELDAGEGEIWREFMLIYNCLTLPSDSLVLCRSAVSAEGAAANPSMIVKRALELFRLEEEKADIDRIRLSAERPAMILAAAEQNSSGPVRAAAARYFAVHSPERYAAIAEAAGFGRGRLSEAGAKRIYGDRQFISPTRADEYAACRYRYFLRYGLGAEKYRTAELNAAEYGTLAHAVLEKLGLGAREKGGFKNIGDELVGELCEEAIKEYEKEVLGGFDDRTERESYLFERMKDDIRAIARETVNELRSSDFEPLEFEFNFSEKDKVPPLALEGGDGAYLTGIADRIDGWNKDGTLYLRVADYKTGKKNFNLQDIWYGKNLQMLLYLYALGENSEKLFGTPGKPAGVMYVPARNDYVSVNSPEDEYEKAQKKTVRRKGIALNDGDVLEAWENGDKKVYAPFVDGRGMKRDSLVTEEQFGLLNGHIKKCLNDMAAGLKGGSMEAEPEYDGKKSACSYCDYRTVCCFREGENNDKGRVRQKMNAGEVWERLQEESENG